MWYIRCIIGVLLQAHTFFVQLHVVHYMMTCIITDQPFSVVFHSFHVSSSRSCSLQASFLVSKKSFTTMASYYFENGTPRLIASAYCRIIWVVKRNTRLKIIEQSFKKRSKKTLITIIDIGHHLSNSAALPNFETVGSQIY